MKKTLIAVLFATALCTIASADVYVHPYLRGDGTYIGGYYRSNPDGYQFNNWSSYGNINPYTGKMGTRW